MRVTAASFGNDFRTQIAKLAERQMRVQRQIATGQRIDSPSDDPQAMRRVLDLRAELRVLNQYRDNIGKIRENSTVAYSSLNAMKKLNDRAGEIATMADDSKPAEALGAYAMEINQLLEEAVRLGNTKHRGVYIFSGTKSTTPTYLIVLNYTYAIGRVSKHHISLLPIHQSFHIFLLCRVPT